MTIYCYNTLLNMNTKWQKAAQILKNGGVVILPSESSYGVAALISSKVAIEKLYKVKKRSDNKPSLIIVGSIDQAKDLVNFTPLAIDLSTKFWPGGLTMVLESKNQSLAGEIYGEGKSLAIRLPGLKNLRELALEVGPFILPSANLNGQKPPYLASEIDPEFSKQMDLVLDEPTGGVLVSTLVDARGEKVIILRQGSVKLLLD